MTAGCNLAMPDVGVGKGQHLLPVNMAHEVGVVFDVGLFFFVIDEGDELAPAGGVAFSTQIVAVGISQDIFLLPQGLQQAFLALEAMELAQFVDDVGADFQILLFQEILKNLETFLFRFAIHLAQASLNFAFGFGRGDIFEPFVLDLLVARRENLNLVAALEMVHERNQFMIDLGADAMRAQERVDAESKVKGGGVGRHRLDFALGREDQPYRKRSARGRRP